MKKYFKNKYALSDNGINDAIKAIKSSALLNILLMLPMFISFIFIKQYSDEFWGIKSSINLTMIHYLIIILAALILMYLFAKYDYDKCFVKVYDESAGTRINLAEKLKKIPLSYFSKKDIADLSATIMTDATIFEHLFSRLVPKVYGNIISILFMTIMLFLFDYRLAFSLFWLVPVSYLVFKLTKTKNQKIMKASFDIDREIIDDMQEGITLAQEIKSYNMKEHFVESMNKKYDNHKHHKIKNEVGFGSIIGISFMLLKLGMSTVAIYGGYLLIKGEVNAFTYLAFIIMSGVVFTPIINVLTNLTDMLYLDSIVERIREINSMPTQEGSSEFTPKGYDINFENVNFSYEDGVEVLKGVSFTAKQGEVTALVGPSGSGKTTAAKLAARFWDTNSGKITLGGIDISTIEPETLLKSFSIVFQDVSLFNASILENIRLGRKGATDEEVKRVAKIAMCDEFIEKLPYGYETMIGENGEKLSGGERQRISIARALLKDAPIILLDESTASLDAENESKIQVGISELVKNKTVIIIAHRMRTVIGADNIVVLKDGKIAELGTSQNLMQNKGIFFNMYNSQFEYN